MYKPAKFIIGQTYYIRADILIKQMSFSCNFFSQHGFSLMADSISFTVYKHHIFAMN